MNELLVLRSLALCALVVLPALLDLSACYRSGQTGDDNAAASDRSAARDGGHGGGPNRVDAGAPPQFEVVYEAVLDGQPSLICAAGLGPKSGAPDAERAYAATHHCEGNEARWNCTCDGAAPVRSYAATCVGALQERCGVAAQALSGRDVPPMAECAASTPSREGKCGQPTGDAFECKCGGRDVPIMREDATAALRLASG
jgi:hypothetical protein